MSRILILLIFFPFCKSPKLILKEPIDKKKSGAIAFGLVIYDSEEKNLFDDSNRLKSPVGSRTNFFEIKENKLDQKNPTQVDFTTDEDPIKIGKKNYIEKNSISFKLSPITYFILSNLDSDSDKILGTTSYIFTSLRIIAQGKRANQTNYENIFLDLENSKEVLPLKISENQFQFFGIYLIELKTLREGNFLDYGEKKIGSLKKAYEVLAKINNAEINKKIFFDSIVSEKNAEKQFLEVFINEYPDNHWRKLAIKRLLELKN